MHDSHNGLETACDDNQDRLGAWLRLLAVAPASALSWRWALRLLGALGVFVFLANLRARILFGRTAVVRPSRTGGADHGLRAMQSGRNPMVFGGVAHAAAKCLMVDARYLPARSVRVRGNDHSWVATRRAVVACFALEWPGDCAANEAK